MPNKLPETPPAHLLARKKELRRMALLQGAGQGTAGFEQQDLLICEHFLKAFVPAPGRVLSFYWPMGHECDTRPIARACASAGMACALPVIKQPEQRRGHGLFFRHWQPQSPLVKSPFGTWEPLPESPEMVPDILLVPLLLADRSGVRLGRGAGHYDATLQSLRATKNICAVGVAHEWQVSDTPLPAEPHDQRLDALATPSGVLFFGG